MLNSGMPQPSCQVTVRVQPRASRTEVAGRQGEAVRIRVAAPPVGGKANEALIRFLAHSLDVPRTAITITAGAKGRTKTVRVVGLDRGTALARLGVTASSDTGGTSS